MTRESFNDRAWDALAKLVRDCETRYKFKDPQFERDVHERLEDAILTGQMTPHNAREVSSRIVRDSLAFYRGLPAAKARSPTAYAGTLSRIQAAYLPLHHRLSFWDADAGVTRDTLGAFFARLEFDHADEREQRRAVCIEELLLQIDPRRPVWPKLLPSRQQYLRAMRDAIMLGPHGLPETPMTVTDEFEALGIAPFSLPDPFAPTMPSVGWFRDGSVRVARKLEALASYARRAQTEHDLHERLSPHNVSGYLRAIVATPGGDLAPSDVHTLRGYAAEALGKHWWRELSNAVQRTAYLERIAAAYRQKEA